MYCGVHVRSEGKLLLIQYVNNVSKSFILIIELILFEDLTLYNILLYKVYFNIC